MGTGNRFFFFFILFLKLCRIKLFCIIRIVYRRLAVHITLCRPYLHDIYLVLEVSPRYVFCVYTRFSIDDVNFWVSPPRYALPIVGFEHGM